MGCSGCGILGFGMLKMWDVWDVECSGCLLRCSMLIYKMLSDLDTPKTLLKGNLIFESSFDYITSIKK